MVNNQDFLNSVYTDIQMVQGDTTSFNFQIEGLAGVTPTFLLSVKEDLSDEAIFTCSNTSGIAKTDYDDDTDTTTFSCTIAANKTVSLDIGRYYYDLKMYMGTNVITLMRGRLDLLYSVAD